MILAVSKRRTLYLFFEYFPKQMNLFVKNKSCTDNLFEVWNTRLPQTFSGMALLWCVGEYDAFKSLFSL